MRTVIFVDGKKQEDRASFISAIECGLKWSDEQEVLRKNYNGRRTVRAIPSPFGEGISEIEHRHNALDFVLSNKKLLISGWNVEIGSDGMQVLQDNLLIVEKSPLCDIDELFGEEQDDDDKVEVMKDEHLKELYKMYGIDFVYVGLCGNQYQMDSFQERIENEIKKFGSERSIIVPIQVPDTFPGLLSVAAKFVKGVSKWRKY